jgi:predicted signal transduction protein with EAL and GGDEF domain
MPIHHKIVFSLLTIATFFPLAFPASAATVVPAIALAALIAFFHWNERATKQPLDDVKEEIKLIKNTIEAMFVGRGIKR